MKLVGDVHKIAYMLALFVFVEPIKALVCVFAIKLTKNVKFSKYSQLTIFTNIVFLINGIQNAVKLHINASIITKILAIRQYVLTTQYYN